MPSFSRMSAWPVGYFRRISSWLLKNRRDISARIAAIDAELLRIGFVTVTYQTVTREDGSTEVSEVREGMSITPRSSLERLMQAYIANGGNPLDVSMFLYPDSTEVIQENPDESVVARSQYPHGGVAYPKTVEYNNPVGEEGASGYEDYEGGYIPLVGYYKARMGGRVDRGSTEDETVVRVVQGVRDWANQEIKEKLQDIEWRITKLSDLREQLYLERNELLVEAFGDSISALSGIFDESVNLRSLMVQNLMDGSGDSSMWGLIYEPSDGEPRSLAAREDMVGILGFTFEDDPSEELLGPS